MSYYNDAQQKAINLAVEAGLNPDDILADGLDEEGYFRGLRDESGERLYEDGGACGDGGDDYPVILTEWAAWPDGFPAAQFVALVKEAGL